MKRKDIVLLDADLSDDANLKKFFKIFPKRSIQNGAMIALPVGISMHAVLLVGKLTYHTLSLIGINWNLYLKRVRKITFQNLRPYGQIYPESIKILLLK